MGEAAPAFVTENLQNGEFQNGVCSNSKGCETVIQGKHYMIKGGDNESGSTFSVRIFDESIGEWITPTVLGTRPNSCKGYYVVPLDDHRILIIKKESTPDDCIWFMEVDTPYVRQQKKKLETEVVAWSKGVRGYAENPIVISGPSGVGKGTLISMLKKEFPTMFGFSISHTTRAPRNMEKDGVDYHFTERSVMEMEIKKGKFLEFASVHGNLYGTSIEAVEVVADAEKRCILDIDVQGAGSVRASSLEAIFIFLCPPSMEELEKRLRARGTEAEEAIINRLRNAEAELEQGKSSGIFDHILYNDNLEQCYENLKKLLGLENGAAVTPEEPSSVGINLPSDFSASKSSDKIIISSEPLGVEKSKNLLVLDVSSLKGGAPGRTRGLDIYTMEETSSESANESNNHKLN